MRPYSLRPGLSVLLALPLLLGLAACTSPSENTGAFALTTRGALDLLPADARVVGHLNLAEARDSDAIGPLYDAGFNLETMTGEGAARIEDFVAQTGFDLFDDIERLYVAGDPENARFVALMYAEYDPIRIDAYLQEQADVDAERTLYRETPVFVSTDSNGETFSFALANDQLMIAGTGSEVRSVLDRMADGGSSLSDNTSMMALLNNAAHPDDAWFAVRDLTQEAQLSANDDLFDVSRFMEHVVLSAGFGDEGLDLVLFGQTAAETNPGDVADLMRGAISGMRMSAKDEPELMRTLDRVKVREDRDAVRLEAFVSETLLSQMRNG
ncbi:MAG: hypothetical protein AAF809_04865 [Bacteroidota bacterium]